MVVNWRASMARCDSLLLSREAVGKFREDRLICAADGVRERDARQPPTGFLGGGGGDLVAVELEEVVGCRDEPPFRPAGGSSATLEASDLAVELQLSEHRLDRRLPLAVERAALR